MTPDERAAKLVATVVDGDAVAVRVCGFTVWDDEAHALAATEREVAAMRALLAAAIRAAEAAAEARGYARGVEEERAACAEIAAARAEQADAAYDDAIKCAGNDGAYYWSGARRTAQSVVSLIRARGEGEGGDR